TANPDPTISSADSAVNKSASEDHLDHLTPIKNSTANLDPTVDFEVDFKAKIQAVEIPNRPKRE
ncbi:hypothetical protein, partial [Chromatium okenii]